MYSFVRRQKYCGKLKLVQKSALFGPRNQNREETNINKRANSK
jgi:hypothetical protein